MPGPQKWAALDVETNVHDSCDSAATSENFGRNQRLDWVVSSGALTRLAPWDQIGGWDTDFFPLDWFDIDFGYRLTKAGFVTVLEPNAYIEHDRRVPS
ncbi:MAG: hypothetical protein F2520_04670 [Actinobacteria bacterium]|nr:hypothetical protein [Actinomycetota bacterium]MTA77535.1 hypothetical protein [Actinomycetota bacterium]